MTETPCDRPGLCSTPLCADYREPVEEPAADEPV